MLLFLVFVYSYFFWMAFCFIFFWLLSFFFLYRTQKNLMLLDLTLARLVAFWLQLITETGPRTMHTISLTYRGQHFNIWPTTSTWLNDSRFFVSSHLATSGLNHHCPDQIGCTLLGNSWNGSSQLKQIRQIRKKVATSELVFARLAGAECFVVCSNDGGVGFLSVFQRSHWVILD
jgi:hypothetical protein